jgi:cytoskeletal protein CcmA (bactofilin family)
VIPFSRRWRNKMAFWNSKDTDNVAGSIIVNDKQYAGGRNVRVVNNKVYVNDKLVNSDDEKTINITINGNIESLQVDVCENVFVTGDVGEVETTNGSVKIEKNVAGNVKTTNGNVKVGGSIGGKCSTVNGSIKGNCNDSILNNDR